jgi:CubicO group peptidase (beta-lactamase class C family)
MHALEAIHDWGAQHAAAAVVGRDGVLAESGDPDRPFDWASVTKLVTTLAVLRAVDRRTIDLDEPAGPPGSTVRHLLAHASGLPFEGTGAVSAPERTRIYSNPGFDLLGELLAARAGAPVAAVLEGEVLGRLGMSGTTLEGRPSAGMTGPLVDLARLGRELLRPTLVEPATFATATRVAFAGLIGVIPGIGRFEPLDWGLGFEVRAAKVPHWTGAANSPATFGHFGGAGTFLWVDPVAGVALACLTDRRFGPWALGAWSALSDAVLRAVAER